MPFFRTFYGKLSGLFLVLILVLGAVLAFISVRAAMRFVDEVDQKVHRSLADTMAVELEPLLADSIDYTAVQERISYLMGINPRIEVYLLGPDGTIKAAFPDEGVVRQAVDPEPLRQYLAEAELPGPMELLDHDLLLVDVAALDVDGDHVAEVPARDVHRPAVRRDVEVLDVVLPAAEFVQERVRDALVRVVRLLLVRVDVDGTEALVGLLVVQRQRPVDPAPREEHVALASRARTPDGGDEGAPRGAAGETQDCSAGDARTVARRRTLRGSFVDGTAFARGVRVGHRS